MTERTTLRLRRGSGGSPRLETTTGPWSARLVGAQGDAATVCLVATRALLLGGDDVDLTVSVDPGLTLRLTDAGGTVAYHGRGRPARLDLRVTVAAGATFGYDASPVVVAGGADLRRRTALDVAPGGRLLLRETLVWGRAGEDGGRLHASTRARWAGLPAYAEDLNLTHPRGALPGMLGDARVLDQVLALGWRPRTAGRPFALAVPGLLHRRLTRAAHESDVGAHAADWAAQLSPPRCLLEFALSPPDHGGEH